MVSEIMLRSGRSGATRSLQHYTRGFCPQQCRQHSQLQAQPKQPQQGLLPSKLAAIRSGYLYRGQQQQRQFLSSRTGQQQHHHSQQQHHPPRFSPNNNNAALLAISGAALAAMTISSRMDCNRGIGLGQALRRHENVTLCHDAAFESRALVTSDTLSTEKSSADAYERNSSHGREQYLPSTTTTTAALAIPHFQLPSTATKSQRSNLRRRKKTTIEPKEMKNKYRTDWDTCLGEGTYGKVHPARVAVTGEKVALKKISKQSTNAEMFRNETNALLRIFGRGGHANISGVRDIYENSTHFFLLLDLVEGGEMYEQLTHSGPYNEHEAAKLMHEIASALAFLHEIGVIHADLKPENLLLNANGNDEDGTIKIIDFGSAEVVSTDDKLDNTREAMEAEIGTPSYWAPERCEENYRLSEKSAPTDLWSVGIILYIMLTGIHPFDLHNKSTQEEIKENIQQDPSPPMTDDFVGHLSPSVLDLLQKLMEPNPAERMTADEMLRHAWVQEGMAQKDAI